MIPLRAISILPPMSNPPLNELLATLTLLLSYSAQVTVSPPSVRPEATLKCSMAFCTAVPVATSMTPVPFCEVGERSWAFQLAFPTLLSANNLEVSACVVTAIWLLMSFTASSGCGVGLIFSEALPVSPFGALTLYTKLSGVLIPSAPSPLLSV